AGGGWAATGWYRVTCTAGHVVQGARQRRHQVVRCGVCGQALFVLPLSPFPYPEGLVEQAGAGSQLGSPWRRPLLAAFLTLTVVIVIFAVLFLVLPSRHGDSPAQAQEHIAAGQEALGKGRFHEALKEFAAANRQLGENPQALTPAEERELTQWHRQASLLASLLSESLDEILLLASR